MTRLDDVDSQRNDERETALDRKFDRDAEREPFVARRVVSDDDRREALRLSFESAFVRAAGGAE